MTQENKKALPFKAELKADTLAREVAYRVLFRCENSGSYSNIALDAALSSTELSNEDRRFVTRLVYGVIERSITLDYIIGKLSSRPTDKIDPAAMMIIRMGLYQMIYMDRVPTHAAVDSSVELSHKYAHKASAFINAALRAYADRRVKIEMPPRSSEDYLSITYGVSKDICDIFVRDMGFERAEKLLGAINESAGENPTIRVNTLKTTKEALIASDKPYLSGAAGRETLIETAIRAAYIPGNDEISSGLFFVQDEASQLCSRALGALPGERVLDACACPGGKSFSIAMDMQNRGQILSCDLHKNKLSLIEEGASRLGISIIQTRAQNGTVFDESIGTFDRVLCDVPCSGTGVMAKKPEIRCKKSEDLSRLPETQKAILSNCSRYLKPGGTLVYSTCALDRSENEDNIKAFLSSNPDFALAPFTAGKIECKEGYITLAPDEHGCDGFFICRMVKIK